MELIYRWAGQTLVVKDYDDPSNTPLPVGRLCLDELMAKKGSEKMERQVEAVLQDPRNYEIVELELEAEPHEAASKLLSVFEPVELLA